MGSTESGQPNIEEPGGKPERGSRFERARKRLILGTIAFAALVALYSVTSWYTSRPAFCNSCHEMTPYYTVWQTGPHAEVACITCHVDPGVVANFAHKFVALKEVWVHFTGDPTFPMPTVELPNERCLRCHDDAIDPGIAEFDHEVHRGGRTCKTCHDATGHAVTAEALERAGILNADVQAQRDARRGVVVGNGAPLEGHVTVVCSKCHDMPASLCVACHEPPRDHPERPCMTCHTPVTWEFVHPDAAAVCVLCHDRPAGHRDGECSLCHARGASWTFVHPASTACGACHTPPKEHYAGSCAACHSPGTPFSDAVFTHPGRTASCTDCHSRPSGHRSGQCSTCHNVGGRWAFAHPTSPACANCHSAPAGHYGPSCANCHSPVRPWASATFAHSRIPGGEHTYREFPCADCHPNGFASSSCVKCHEGGAPDEDDD